MRTRHEAERSVYPISYAQQRMWLLDRLEPGDPAYNIVRAFRIHGPLAILPLQESLRTIVARHASLRTSFVEVAGEPVQVVAADGALELPTLDLSNVSASECQVETLRFVRQAAQQPFDLASGSLLRVKLLRLSQDEHVLVLVLHHIITDAWSMSVLLEEIGRLYEAFVAGMPSPLPDLPIQYGEFARWQREVLTGDVMEKQLAYWRKQLEGSNAVLELPTDRRRPLQRTPHGATQTVVLSRQLRDQLKAFAHEANATLFMTLLAALQTLLWRYTGCDDVVIGSPIAGRREVELEPLIGFFVNTLAMRTDLSGNPTFRELLARVRDVAFEAYAHQDVPFEKIIEALQVPRSLSYTPLFQVMFILQNAPKQRMDLPNLAVEDFEVASNTAKFDLTVEMAEIDEGLSCRFEYSIDLFDSATVTRMLGHFQCLLEGIVADPGQRLSALPLLSAPERQQLLVGWNNTTAAYPQDACIHELFDAQAKRTPDAIALSYRAQEVTYSELNARANQLAQYLSQRGVRRGVLVGICIERSVEAVVGLLGILKAGGAYVAMDPTYPQQRLTFMLEDSRAPVVLTTQRLRERIPPGTAEVICLDTDWYCIALESPAPPDSGVTSHDLAYIIYTSGSTGTPKGVLAPHRAAVNRFAWMWHHWEFKPGEICCQKTALSFVDSVWEIFGPLLQGVRSVIIPDDVLGAPLRLIELLAVHRITRVVLVPSFLRLLLDHIPNVGSRLADLQFWFTSGEAITPELARRFAETLPDAILVNLYGSSEVAADVTWYVIKDSQWSERIPIGRPIANTQIYVLDGDLNPVPVGIAGEIYVGGDGLAQGYLNHPELTSQKFIADPFTTIPGARLYKTGDLGRFRPDGNVEFLGRVDTQVKLRGIRIELGEVESVLCRHPAIRAAAVAVAGTGGDERLIGYLVPHDNAPPANELRRFMQERLPDHMVPALFVTLDTLPYMPNGKVDRRALPEPEQARTDFDHAYIAPQNPTEEKLAKIMAEVLQITRVGIHDNFFELGGHSLLGIQVIARVRKIFQVDLPLRSLFQKPTVAELSLEIAGAEQHSTGSVTPPPAGRISPREQLLAQLAELSDAEISALLNSPLVRRQEEREIESF